MPLALVLLLAGCAKKDGSSGDEGPLPPSVLLLVTDGVRVEELSSDWASDLTGMSGEDYAADLWGGLGRDAAVFRVAYNPAVTITAPGHAQMLTGRIDPLANFGVEAEGAGLYRPERPTLFEAARSQLGLSQDEAVLLANTELLMPVTASVFPGLGEELGGGYVMVVDPERPDAPINDDEPMFEELKALIDAGPPRVLVVNLHDVDRAGHHGGGDAYIADVKKLDGLLAELWRWIGDHHPAYQASLMLALTSDHGRHRHDGDNGWHNHGDACTGCREVPLFLYGPGVRAGSELEDPVALIDLAPTFAAHLGVALPFAEGLPLTPAFPDLAALARAGEVDVVAAGDTVAVTRWREDFAARAEVVVDGEPRSTAGAWGAAAARAWAEGDTVIVCHRELLLTPGADTWPWTGACRAEVAGAEADLPALEPTVAADWSPAFARVDGALYAAYAHNPDSIGELGADEHVSIRVRRLDGSAWSDPWTVNEYFPTHVELVATGSNLVALVATNQGGEDSRYTRRLHTWHLVVDGDRLAAEGSDEFTLEELLGTGTRVERGALRAHAGGVDLVMVGISASSAAVAVSSSSDGGASWSTPVALPPGDPPISALPPAWDGDAAVWATQGEDGASLCRARLGDPSAACVPVGGWVDSFAVTDAGWLASVSDGGPWEVVEVPPP